MLRGLAALLAMASIGAAPAKPSNDAPFFAPASADPCDLAVATLVSEKFASSGMAVVFSEEAPGDRVISGGYPGKTVSAVAACPKVRAWLDTHGIRYGEAAVAKMQGQVVGSKLVIVVKISLPLLSVDRREANMFEIRGFGSGNPSGYTRTFWRDGAGGWRTSVFQPWIS